MGNGKETASFFVSQNGDCVKKKKILIFLMGIGIYSALAMGMCYQQYRYDLEQQRLLAEEVIVDPLDEFFVAADQREYLTEVSRLMYSGLEGENRYVEGEELRIEEVNSIPMMRLYGMPVPERMDEEGKQELMSDLQVLQRIVNLQINPYLLYTPEYDWKVVYQDSLKTVKEAVDFSKKVSFTGSTASELNEFLADHEGKTVEITSGSILLDETIKVPSNIMLEGNHVKLIYGGKSVEYAILVDGVQNVGIMDFELSECSKHGIYVVNSNKVLIFGNAITGLKEKAICVMDRCSYVNLAFNHIYENGEGGIFTNGDISDCIFQGNVIYNNKGTRNLQAGIVFSSMPVLDPYDPKNPFPDEHLYNLLEAPHRMVILDNSIENNYSSGIYCDGGYQMYVMNNTLADNEKEGICLDYGSFGDYVANNTIVRNGERNRQEDEDLKADFVYEVGRLEDGSSPFKLPGISIDNSAYNIVAGNHIADNSGSGVKMVRSAYRNLIVDNMILNNNRGVNELFHGFGVELGYAAKPDEPVVGLDFTADYENIITRNTVRGSHYAGIFLASQSYCNDVYNNMIWDAEQFSIETHSSLFNSCVDNLTNRSVGDFPE